MTLGKVLYQGLVATLLPFVFANGLYGNMRQNLPHPIHQSSSKNRQQNGRSPLYVGSVFNLGDVIMRVLNRHELTWDNGNETQTYDIFDVEVEAQTDIRDFRPAVRGINAAGQPVGDYFVWKEAKERVIEQFSSVNIKELDKGRKAIGYIAFRGADNITEVELRANSFAVDKVVVKL